MKKILFLMLITFLLFGTQADLLSKKNNNIELGKRYLKLSNTYRIAGNYIKAEDALSKAQDFIYPSKNKYWMAAVYEYYANIQYDLGKEHIALLYYYKAYKIHLLMTDIYDGSDAALFKLIKVRYSGIWQKYLSEKLQDAKLKLKLKKNHKIIKLNKDLQAKRFIKLSNTYLNIYQTTLNNEDLSKAESFLLSAEKLLGNSINKYWDAVCNEEKGYIKYLLNEEDESKTNFYTAYRTYRNIIMLIDGSDDAIYELMNVFWPNTDLTNPKLKNQKSFYKLQKAYGIKNYHPHEEG